MTAPLLDIRGLSLKLRSESGDLPILSDVSLAMNAGEIVGLVGESGSGKSMLAKALIGLPPRNAVVATERFGFSGTDLAASAAAHAAIRGTGIGFVLQEPTLSLNPSMRVGEQLAEALIHHRGLRAGAVLSQRIHAALAAVQINNPESVLRRYPHEFSGGQRQRLLIAAVMLLEPQMVIADEPATALDALVGNEILDLLVRHAREKNSGLLLISHDIAQVAHRVDRVMVMDQGSVVENRATSELLRCPAHQRTRSLLAAVTRRTAVEHTADCGRVILEIDQLTVRYQKARLGWRRAQKREVLSRASLKVHAGETVAIIGESGSGKSTLALAALGLLTSASGTVMVDGQTWTQRTGGERIAVRRRVQAVFQDPSSSLDPRMRIEQIVGEGLRHSGLSSRERIDAVHRGLHDVGLSPTTWRRYPHELSGGQRQRVAIARALVLSPELIIADEPVSALDVTIQEQIVTLLDTLKREKGFGLLFITHDLAVVSRIADRVIVLRNGQILEEGAASRVLSAPRDPYTRALLACGPRLVPEGSGWRLIAGSCDPMQFSHEP